MRVLDDQVTTAEVKDWEGLHLLHFVGSSCSQKVRTLLALYRRITRATLSDVACEELAA